MNDSVTGRPSRLEWLMLLLLLAVGVGFGAMVEMRSAFLSRRMGDLGCYLRPAWAILHGKSIYDVTDNNGWHYNYPPLYAILMIPLADPDRGEDSAGYVPYAASVAIVYLLNMLCLILAVHLLASALERHAADPGYREQPRFCRRWWALRVWPILVCLAPIGHTCMRGQVNLQVLALLSGWLACVVGGRRLLGGFLLAIAICIKVIPIYLLVYPLWRRDMRTFAGCGLGLVVGLAVVPLAVMGPKQMVSEYKEYANVFFGPLMHLSDDKSREVEILGMNATDSTGIKHAIHNWLYLDPRERPRDYSPAEEWTHRGLALLMTLAVLWPTRRLPSTGVAGMATEFSALLLLMVVLSPISHAHYYTFCLPLVMSLLFIRWQRATSFHVGWPLALALAWFTVMSSVPTWPGLEDYRDLCFPLFGALPLFALGVAHLWRRDRHEGAVQDNVAPRLAA
jgi:hypothetical protein